MPSSPRSPRAPLTSRLRVLASAPGSAARASLRGLPYRLALSLFVFSALLVAAAIEALARRALPAPVARGLLDARPADAVEARVWGLPRVTVDVAIGAGKGATAGRAGLDVEYQSLPMTRPEADLLMSYLQPGDVYLEWGSSGTSLTFPRLVKDAYTIDDNPHVCAAIRDEVASHAPDLDNLRTFCAAKTPPTQPLAPQIAAEGTYATHAAYVDYPLEHLPEKTFDKVLINGAARVACALRILPHLHADSVVFFHDWFLRPDHYTAVLAHYEEVSRIVPIIRRERSVRPGRAAPEGASRGG
jgi:hypothetical protein